MYYIMNNFLAIVNHQILIVSVIEISYLCVKCSRFDETAAQFSTAFAQHRSCPSLRSTALVRR